MTDCITTFSNSSRREYWNNFVANSQSGHLMQSCEWGDFKVATGWQVQRVGLERNGKLIAGAQILLRSLPRLPFSIAYIPKGPIVDFEDSNALTQLFSVIHQIACNKRAIFLKIEPHLLDNAYFKTTLQKRGFKASTLTNQPRSTIIIDLSKGENSILANMRRKTRQLIHKASREGVEIVQGDAQDIEQFYSVLKSTGKTKDFSIHHIDFYQQMWQAFQHTNTIQLLLAKYQGEVVAGKMICVYGDKSMHLWGGTSLLGRKMYASYLIQWEAIRWAISRGCKYCDLWGIPDEVGSLLKKGQSMPQKDDKGGLWGVYKFKRGFGGDVIYYIGAYDYPYQSFLYWLGVKFFANSNSVDTISKWSEKIHLSRSTTS